VDWDKIADDEDKKAYNAEQVDGEFGRIDSEAAQGEWRGKVGYMAEAPYCWERTAPWPGWRI
jgi:hypothetical protein